jgi:hypothetical protein
LESASHPRERNDALLRVHAVVRLKSADAADIVRDDDVRSTDSGYCLRDDRIWWRIDTIRPVVSDWRNSTPP